MNEKLRTKWRSTDPALRPVHARCGGVCKDDRLVAITAREVKGSGGKYYFVTMSFHARAIEKAGWLLGDRLAFEFDEGHVLVERNRDGYKLAKASKQATRSRVVWRLVSEYAALMAEVEATEIEIESGRMAFVLKRKGC